LPLATAARTQGPQRTGCITFLLVSEAGDLTNHLARFPWYGYFKFQIRDLKFNLFLGL